HHRLALCPVVSLHFSPMRIRAAERIPVVLVAAVLLLSGRSYAAERQIRPFMGATFGGGTTIVDPELAAGDVNMTFGLGALFLGEVFGAEVEIADSPGFFEAGKNLVRGSRVTTVSGSVVVAAPRRL